MNPEHTFAGIKVNLVRKLYGEFRLPIVLLTWLSCNSDCAYPKPPMPTNAIRWVGWLNCSFIHASTDGREMKSGSGVNGIIILGFLEADASAVA